MLRGPLVKEGYTPQFSGHETFPLRYGWLKKAFDRVLETEDSEENRLDCWGDDAIARFGVGKNMVKSMRHWANAIGVIEESTATKSVTTTKLGRFLFGPNGLDPYMEHPSTLWLVHWQLASCPKRTTWFWAFSYCSTPVFERDGLQNSIRRLAEECGWLRVAKTTLKNDVSCFIRTYVAKQTTKKSTGDDILESPLTELGLVKSINRKDGFRFVRGPKATLTDGLFAYAFSEYWIRNNPDAATLSFESIAHAPGSPGRVFALDEEEVVNRLIKLEETTGGHLRWSETVGLKQVIRAGELKEEEKYAWLEADYTKPTQKRAA